MMRLPLPKKFIGCISKNVKNFHYSWKEEKELKQEIHFDIVADHVVEDPFAIFQDLVLIAVMASSFNAKCTSS
jgi:hypothetical protein